MTQRLRPLTQMQASLRTNNRVPTHRCNTACFALQRRGYSPGVPATLRLAAAGTVRGRPGNPPDNSLPPTLMRGWLAMPAQPPTTLASCGWNLEWTARGAPEHIPATHCFPVQCEADCPTPNPGGEAESQEGVRMCPDVHERPVRPSRAYHYYTGRC